MKNYVPLKQIKSEVNNEGSEFPMRKTDENSTAISEKNLIRASAEDKIMPELMKYGGEILIEKQRNNNTATQRKGTKNNF